VGEDLRLKVILVGRLGAGRRSAPGQLVLHWRPLGKGEFSTVPVEHVARGVYTAKIPADRIAGRDFEYYVQAGVGAEAIRFPMTAPAMNQTVAVMREKD